MCGVNGILYKNATGSGFGPVGDDLVKMLESMTHWGKDSSGITVAGEDLAGDLVIRIWTGDESQAADTLARVEDAVARSGGVVNSKQSSGQFLRLVVNYEGDVATLAEALINTPGVALHGIGETSEVVKDVGTPVAMDDRHLLSQLTGTHGIGHVRMATESIVDVNHAHPFLGLPLSRRDRGA